MTIYNREDYRTVLPQLEKRMRNNTEDLSNAKEDINTLQGRIAELPTTLDSMVVERYTHEYSTIASGSNLSWDETVTKDGYYPIGVVGFRSARAQLVVDMATIDSVTSGSCRVRMNARALSNTSASTAEIHVLWIKEK